MSDRIEKSIEIAAPVDRVWRALTDSQEFGAWFRVRLDGPFEVGRTTTGQITHPGYEHYRWLSTTTRKDETARVFAFTWNHSEDPSNPTVDDPVITVEFRLEPAPKGTRLTVVESGFEALPPEKRAKAIRENTQGWEQQMENVRAHVERPSA